MSSSRAAAKVRHAWIDSRLRLSSRFRDRVIARALARAVLRVTSYHDLSLQTAVTARAFARDTNLELAVELARELAVDLPGGLVRYLGSSIGPVVADCDRPHQLDCSTARERKRAAALARRIKVELDLLTCPATPKGCREETPVTPTRMSHRLITWAMCMLPERERCRYQDEFLAELYDLPRRHQILYALRQLTRSWSLRRSLNASADMRLARSRE